ncbi:hypothetical protein RFI_00546 [Reticulomyxa filosa]|uniref:CNNM transmembrane domain-containing protein n=1 Tax=Reticulomyxa filosa TaxID=46433 RepID=X6PEI0_RETFI|nr:hypothetical protein RFI_00546 [Reticulomyxa filosa]|eukprot:ETO36513.1 hypothetical protein RFI_00546 [Reticulomyxa filosa]
MSKGLEEFVALTILHWSNGTRHYFDDKGLAYERVPIPLLAHSEGGGGIIKSVPLEEWILWGLLSTFCVLFAGLTSGLNLSLLALNPLKIKFLEQSGDERQKKVNSVLIVMVYLRTTVAERIKPLVKNRHLMLVTLLVCNAASLESLPIFLDKLVSSWLAIVVSVVIVLFFGEIFPQAWLASDPLKAGYYFGWLVQVLEVITFPITYPLAWLLDKIIKHEHSIVFTHEEMATLFDVIAADKEYAETRQQFDRNELLLLEGALRLRKLTVEKEMVKWDDVKTFPYGLVLDEDGMASIWESGFSRVPVYKEHEMDIIGICLVKVISYSLSFFPLNFCVIFGLEQNIILLIHKKRICCWKKIQMTHFALITRDVDVVNECLDKGLTIPRSVRFLGAITLEDITEELIQEEIEDEYSKEK